MITPGLIPPCSHCVLKFIACFVIMLHATPPGRLWKQTHDSRQLSCTTRFLRRRQASVTACALPRPGTVHSHLWCFCRFLRSHGLVEPRDQAGALCVTASATSSFPNSTEQLLIDSPALHHHGPDIPQSFPLERLQQVLCPVLPSAAREWRPPPRWTTAWCPSTPGYDTTLSAASTDHWSF